MHGGPLKHLHVYIFDCVTLANFNELIDFSVSF